MNALSLSFPILLSSFGLIFVAELPDKTALASLVLATRYPTRQVIVGAWLAFLVQTLVAIAGGMFLQLLPSRPVRIAAGLGFLVFAWLAFRREDEEEVQDVQEVLEETEGASRPATRLRRPAWLTCFLVVFAAEWGDLTQLATAALVAQTGNALSVGIGATTALWSVTVIAAVAGRQLGRLLAPSVLKIASTLLFLAVGLAVLGSAVLNT